MLRIAIFILSLTIAVQLNAQNAAIPVEIGESRSDCDVVETSQEVQFARAASQVISEHVSRSAALRLLSSRSASSNRIKLSVKVGVDDLRVAYVRRIYVFVELVPANGEGGRLWWIIEGGGWGSDSRTAERYALQNLRDNLDRLLGSAGARFLGRVFENWDAGSLASLNVSLNKATSLYRRSLADSVDCEIYEGHD